VDPELIAKFPEYTELSYLADGVYGVVYRATQCNDKMLVALKYTKFINGDFLNFFDREVEALNALSHSAYLPYIHSIKWGSDGIIVTPLQLAGTLDTAIKMEYTAIRSTMWPRKKVIIVLGVAFGIEYLHKQGFVHMDLNTANIFLNDDSEPAIADFGLTTTLTGVYPTTGPSMALGTPLHMAPEL
jgi:p21-activated kinase